jgi:hypothetical protein
MFCVYRRAKKDNKNAKIEVIFAINVTQKVKM